MNTTVEEEYHDKQHILAHILLAKKPDLVLVQQGLSEQMILRDPLLAEKAKKAFPKGIIPAKSCDLNCDQRRFLIEQGAIKTLFLLGKISTIDLFTGDLNVLIRSLNEMGSRIVVLHNGRNSDIKPELIGQSTQLLDSSGKEEPSLDHVGYHPGATTAFHQSGLLRQQQLPTYGPSMRNLNQTMWLQAGLAFLLLFFLVTLWEKKQRARQATRHRQTPETSPETP